jgi:hypothetical protein
MRELGQLVKGFEGRSLYPIVAVAAYAGMRRNEILALRWDADIDLDRAMISVTRNVEETDKYGRRIITPKAKNSIREFQIDASLVALLRQEREKALRIVAGVPADAAVDLSLVKLPMDALAFPEFGTLTKLRSPDSVTNSSYGVPASSDSRSISTTFAPRTQPPWPCSMGAYRCMSSPSGSGMIPRPCCVAMPGAPRRPTPMPPKRSQHCQRASYKLWVVIGSFLDFVLKSFLG